jgi:hypothetical protein
MRVDFNTVVFHESTSTKIIARDQKCKFCKKFMVPPILQTLQICKKVPYIPTI